MLPLHKVKRLIKSENTVKAVSGEAGYGIARATVHHLLQHRYIISFEPAGCTAGDSIGTSVLQELLLEQLLQRAYQNMIAENRASIEYEDIGGFSPMHCLLPIALLFAVPDVAAWISQPGCCAASAVNKWPATDFLKGSHLTSMDD